MSLGIFARGDMGLAAFAVPHDDSCPFETAVVRAPCSPRDALTHRLSDRLGIYAQRIIKVHIQPSQEVLKSSSGCAMSAMASASLRTTVSPSGSLASAAQTSEGPAKK